jgi:hypothetical protein
MHRLIFQGLKTGKNLKGPPPAFYGFLSGPHQAAYFT